MSTPKLITPLKRLLVLVFAGTMASSCAVTGGGIHPAVPLLVGGAIIGSTLSNIGRHHGGGHRARSHGHSHRGHGRGWRRGGRGWDHGGGHRHRGRGRNHH